MNCSSDIKLCDGFTLSSCYRYACRSDTAFLAFHVMLHTIGKDWVDCLICMARALLLGGWGLPFILVFIYN